MQEHQVTVDGQTLILPPKHRPLAAAVDQDQRLQAPGSGDGGDPRLHSSPGEGLVVQPGGIVVTQLADVACAHPPLLAGDHGRRDLAAGQHAGIAVLHLGTGSGIGVERDQRVGRVQSDADQIHFWQFLHHFTVNGV